MRRKVDELGRIVIPEDARRAFCIHEGGMVNITVKEGYLVIEPLDPACRLCGSPEELEERGGYLLCRRCIKAISEKPAGAK